MKSRDIEWIGIILDCAIVILLAIIIFIISGCAGSDNEVWAIGPIEGIVSEKEPTPEGIWLLVLDDPARVVIRSQVLNTSHRWRIEPLNGDGNGPFSGLTTGDPTLEYEFVDLRAGEYRVATDGEIRLHVTYSDPYRSF